MPGKEQINLNPQRTLLALHAARRTWDDVARAAGRSTRQIKYVVTGERRGSVRIYDAFRAVMGDAGWRYAMGESDYLPCTKEPA